MNAICELFKIQYPIIQGGMVWVSGGKLAASVSNAGGLGLIGAGSMQPDLLDHHIKKAKSLTQNPLGVNIPLLYSKADEQIRIALENDIKIFFTSAGSPKKFTNMLKDHGAIVVHVTSTPDLALKCEDAGVDAVVAEGFEAGGHNGRDELTSMTLIPQVRDSIKIPLIAAGGIVDAKSMLAAMILGADGVQMGTRFVLTAESSAHLNYKNYLLEAGATSTKLLMKNTTPVRLIMNPFAHEVLDIESRFSGEELTKKLNEHLGKFRAKNGMLEGDIKTGELEIGQAVSRIKNIPTVSEVFTEIIEDYKKLKSSFQSSNSLF
jgi:enoyl-[acyl-carrier protein] reductase II